MCRVNVVVNRIMLGNRELGWEVWNGRSIDEYTSKQIENIIRAGKDKVLGLKIGNGGTLEADREGFFTTSIMEHRHIGNYKPMDSDSLVNMSYICMGTDTVDGVTVYKCISNKFERADLSEEQIRAYLTLGILTGGARLKDGRIEVAGSEPVDRKSVADSDKPVEPEKKAATSEATKPVEVEKPDTAKKETKSTVSKKDEKKTITCGKVHSQGERG